MPVCGHLQGMGRTAVLHGGDAVVGMFAGSGVDESLKLAVATGSSAAPHSTGTFSCQA